MSLQVAQEPPPAASAASAHKEAQVVLRNIYACYFLSGSLGLVYQILWLRKLLLVFGSTVHAVSAVLTVFFGGLALGSWWFGRLIDRREGAGLRWYAVLEAGVGLYAFITLPLFEAIQHLYLPIYRASGSSPLVLAAASFICSTLILLVPTTLLGGTFPVLSRFLIRTFDERGVKIAGLYGLNTAGAMAGTLLVYFIGLPILGLFRTLLCAGVVNLGIGALCLTFDRHLDQLGYRRLAATPSPEQTAPLHDIPGGLPRLLIAFGLSGFSAMVYEVAWTRALSLVVGSSIYAFCIMLATFLGGIALGSAWARRVLRRRPGSLAQCVGIEVALGVYGLASLPLFARLPEWFVRLWPVTGGSFSGLVGLQWLLAALVMIAPTILMGVLFPIVADLVTQSYGRLGRRLGGAYAVNTVGGIAGSFLSGFVLIPLMGLPQAIIVAAMVNLIAAALIYVGMGLGHARRRRRLVVAGAGLLGMIVLSQAVLIPVWQREVFAAGAYLSPDVYRNRSVREVATSPKLLYYRDSLNATVSVHQEGPGLFLKVGGKTDASNGLDMSTQVLSAHIPLLLHEQPQRVLVIGLGSGVTLGQAGRHPVSTLHCAELDPAVIEGARFFSAYNDSIHEDPRAAIVAADGRNFLLASPARYDVIISEPSNPWMAGIGYLFTQEFYQLAKRRLAPGGLMAQWLQLYRISPDDVKLVLKTFHAEFPHMSVWSTLEGDLVLIGSMAPHQRTSAQLAERMAVPSIREGLAAVRVMTPEMLLQLLLFGTAEVEQLTSDVRWIHRDDQPWLEFSAPKALYRGLITRVNAGGVERFKSSPQSIVPDYDASREDAAFHEAMASLWSFRQQPLKAKEALERAVSSDPSLSEAWLRLGELHLQLRAILSAQEALMRSIALAPHAPDAYQALARMHWQQRQPELARRFYVQAASLQVPDSLFAEELGNCWREDDPRVAAEFYRSSMSQGGGSRRSLVANYAATLKTLKSWAAAEQVLTFAMTAFPDEAAVWLAMGEVLLEQDRASEAKPYFRHALTIAPRHAQAYYGLGRIAFQQGHREEAVRFLKTGLRDDPYHREALTLLQRIQREKT